jgi:hypothetical protein
MKYIIVRKVILVCNMCNVCEGDGSKALLILNGGIKRMYVTFTSQTFYYWGKRPR